MNGSPSYTDLLKNAYMNNVTSSYTSPEWMTSSTETYDDPRFWESYFGKKSGQVDEPWFDESSLLDILTGGASKAVKTAGKMSLPHILGAIVGMGGGSAPLAWSSKKIGLVDKVNDLVTDRFKSPMVSWFKDAPLILAEPTLGKFGTVGRIKDLENTVNTRGVVPFYQSIENAPLVRRFKSEGYTGPVIGISPQYIGNRGELMRDLANRKVRTIPREYERFYSRDQLADMYPSERDIASLFTHEIGHPLYDNYFGNSIIAKDVLEDLGKNVSLTTMLSNMPSYKNLLPGEMKEEIFTRSIEPLANKIIKSSPMFEDSYHRGISPNFIELMDKFLQGSPKFRTPLDFGAAFNTNQSLENALKQLGGTYDPSWGNILYKP